MLKTVKSFAILAVVIGLMAGCSSNQTVEEPEDTIEADTTMETGSGVDGSRVDVEDGRSAMDAIENVAKTFYFEFDSSVLKPEARAALIAHAEYIRNNDASVRLEGHADERGSREYNMALGERRANSVRDFLVLQGVDRSAIETVSYGEERPAQTGSSEFAWSRNRRVELKYQ